jgi:hypothetical protein
VSLTDLRQPAGTFQVVVDYQDVVFAIALAHGAEDFDHRLTKDIAVRSDFVAGPQELIRILGFLNTLKNIDCCGIAPLFQILNGDIHRHHIVAMRRPFDAFNANRHRTLIDDRDGTGGVDGFANASIETINVLAIALQHLQAMAFQGLANAETRQISRRMPGDGDIVIVNNDLYVEMLSDGKAGGFSIVAFLLGAIRPQTEHRFARVTQGHTIDIRPHMTKSPRAELNPWSQT